MAYRLGRRWETVIEDKNVISDSRSIIGLSKYGIMVNSETSKSLVRYLADVEQLNYDTIPEVSSVGRLGWIDGYGFSPYEEDLVFDGEETFRTRFESIQEKGSRQAWLDCVRSVRAGKHLEMLLHELSWQRHSHLFWLSPAAASPFSFTCGADQRREKA